MKLLAFSDLHRSRDHARSLVDRAPGADVVIGAGDFASMRLGLNSTIDSLASIDSPAILTPGNSESDTALWRACAGWPSASVLHGTGIRIAGVEFFGLGGGVPPTPFRGASTSASGRPTRSFGTVHQARCWSPIRLRGATSTRSGGVISARARSSMRSSACSPGSSSAGTSISAGAARRGSARPSSSTSDPRDDRSRSERLPASRVDQVPSPAEVAPGH